MPEQLFAPMGGANGSGREPLKIPSVLVPRGAHCDPLLLGCDMPESEIGKRFDDLRSLVEGIDQRLEKREERDIEERRLLNRLLYGNGEFKGIMGRIQSLEEFRDEVKARWLTADRLDHERRESIRQLWRGVILTFLAAASPWIWKGIEALVKLTG